MRPGESAESKLPLLYADLGVTTDSAALLALATRHVSGLQRAGPKSRAYPSSPLRWHLKPHEKPEDKLALVCAHLGSPNPKEALLRLASRHVPGFRYAGPLRNGGRKRTNMTTEERSSRPEAVVPQAEGDEAWLCDIIDMYREHAPARKLWAIAYELSRLKPAPGCENPAYGADPKWIVQRYTNRKRYDKAADRRFERIICRLKATLRMRAQTAQHH